MQKIEGESFLLSVAALALSFAGFSGVIIAFRRRASDWAPQETAGMQFVLQHVFAACFFRLLPFPCFFYLGSAKLVWSICSALLCVFLFVILVLHINKILALRLRGTPPRMEKGLLYIVLPLTTFFSILQAYNFSYGQSLNHYSAGLVWLLTAAGIQFFVFLRCLLRIDS